MPNSKQVESRLSQEEQEALRQSLMVQQMVNSQGWLEVVRPFLTDKLNQSFPDPTQFTKEDEFLYAAKTASVFKKVIAELLGWIDQHKNTVEELKRKEKGELEDEFAVGG